MHAAAEKQAYRSTEKVFTILTMFVCMPRIMAYSKILIAFWKVFFLLTRTVAVRTAGYLKRL